jgi:CHAT domain-containing protein
VVVADGALEFIPFGLLPAGGRPLVAQHEVVHLPSASALAVVRAGLSGRTPAPKALAVFADPVFEAGDPRVHSSGASRSMPRGAPASRGGQESMLRLPRLPFSRREARDVLALVPVTERKEALDFEANRDVATRADLAEYRIVHFATHGLIDGAHPQLSGLVLSLVDPSGRPRPGFLSAIDVFNLKLSADLVVLSACRTALGREVRGEGLVGLTRGFMYAGAPRVVASLWTVDDAATAELMRRFYQAMLGPRSLAPTAALREAQLAVRGLSRWRHPHYWAGFVLQGEWR